MAVKGLSKSVKQCCGHDEQKRGGMLLHSARAFSLTRGAGGKLAASREWQRLGTSAWRHSHR